MPKSIPEMLPRLSVEVLLSYGLRSLCSFSRKKHYISNREWISTYFSSRAEWQDITSKHHNLPQSQLFLSLFLLNRNVTSIEKIDYITGLVPRQYRLCPASLEVLSHPLFLPLSTSSTPPLFSFVLVLIKLLYIHFWLYLVPFPQIFHCCLCTLEMRKL